MRYVRWRTEIDGVSSYIEEMIDKPIRSIDKLKAALREERLENLCVAERHAHFLARVTACGEGVDDPPTVGEFLIWQQDYLFRGVWPRRGLPAS